MASSRFRNNLLFALGKESLEMREKIPLNRIEKIGDKLAWFAYDFRTFCSEVFFDPRVLTIFFTLLSMIFVAFLFYPLTTWSLFATVGEWIINHMNGKYIRFCLWVLSEVTVFGIGMRAFGRFTNEELLKSYQEQGRVA
jgi:hypothetical protein